MEQTDAEVQIVAGGRMKVWDFPIRLFHWLLVLGIAVAYLSAKYRFGGLHILIGYALCILLLARLCWGVVGSKYARFASFHFSLRETAAYVRAMVCGNPRHYVGHNPAGALMVFAMLALLTLIFFTGMVTDGAIDFDGPFSAIAARVDDETCYLLKHLHSWLINLGIGLVIVHLVGVAWGSVQHRENLVKAMVTGFKAAPSVPNSETENNK